MQQTDLLALSERLFDQLGLEYGKQDDGGLILLTEGDRTLYVGTDGVTDDDGREWPLLTLFVPVLQDVDLERVDMDLLASANEASPFGAVMLARDQALIIVHHQAVGWPGAAEYRITWELMIASGEAAEKVLAGRIPGNPPMAYSEVVS